jgi:uncharacterized protein
MHTEKELAMAVITKYIVVRNGVELEHTFTDKKEAQAYDQMLDASQEIAELIRQGDLQINVDARTIDDISIFLAKNAPAVAAILKAVKPIRPGTEGLRNSKPKAAATNPAPETPVKSKNKAA